MAEATPPGTETEVGTITSTDGTEIAFERMGDGPPIVLVHGATVDRRIWHRTGVGPALADHCTVYAIDRRGHGESDDDTEFELEREVDDVVTMVESIDEPVIVLGHSAGGTRALEAALRTDNVRGLVLYEPAIPVGEDAFDVEEEVAEMVDLLEDGENEQAYLLFLDEIAQLTPEELEALRSDPIWTEYASTFHETLLPRLEAFAEYDANLERFEALTTPTLLVAGSESGWLKAVTDAVGDVLPNSTLVTFDGHGHAMIFTAPERFTDEVVAFVEDSR